MATFNDFYNYAYGKVFNTEGNVSSRTTVNWNYPYDGQCVSLIKAYLKYLGYGVKAYGNAIDYWTGRNSNGILSVCNVVTGSPKNGDIGVSAGIDPTYGHVFIYKDGQAFAQNVSGAKATLSSLSIQGQIYGYLRPKCLASSSSSTSSTSSSIPSGFTEQHATFTVGVNRINVRDKASTSGNIVATYDKGEKVNYDCYKAEKSGYCWISYVSNSGKRRYMACGETNASRVNVTPYGTFK